MAEQGPGTLEKPEDAGKGKEGVVKRWLMEWKLATDQEEPWRNLADAATKRYADKDQETAKKGQKGAQETRALGTKFNILRANVDTLLPALYNSMPKPDVRRRFRDPDPLGKAVADVLERAIGFQIETGNYDACLKLAVKDMLLPGRGVTRVRYEPKIAQKKTGETEHDYKAWEAVCYEHVQWRNFRRGPGRTWDEVSWIGFELFPTKDEAEEMLGKLPEGVELDVIPEGLESAKAGPDADTFKRLRIYEIWDKEEREVLFIAPGFTDKPLLVEPDPLKLEEFFPIPRPLYACEQTDSLVPVEDYRAYRDQAEELDKITARISKVVSAIRVRGVADSSIPEFEQLFTAGENEIIASQGATALRQLGGLEKAVWFLPIDILVKVLVSLYDQREQIKKTIYELTGIADIMRGLTEASETLGAQKLKSAYGGQRISERQRDVQRYARELVALTGEIIAEHFDAPTLALMTGLQFAPQMMPPLPGQPPPPIAWPQIVQVLRSDALRCYKVDIETDSTVAGDLASAQENAGKFVEGLASLIGALGPIVQEGAMPKDVAMKIVAGFSQMFKLPRSVTDAVEGLADQPPAPPQAQPDPNAPAMAKVQADAQARMQEVQQQPAIEQMREQMKAASAQHAAQVQQQTEMAKIRATADLEWRKAVLSSLTSIEVAGIGAGVQANTDAFQAKLDAILGIHQTETDAQLQREQIAAQPADTGAAE